MKTISLLLVSLVAFAPLARAADAPARKPADTRWFEEARFGMFITFGLKTEAKDGGLVVGLPPGGPPDERVSVVVLEFDSNPVKK